MTDEEIICKGLDEAATGDEIDAAFDALYRLTAELARKDAALDRAANDFMAITMLDLPKAVVSLAKIAEARTIAALGESEKGKNNG